MTGEAYLVSLTELLEALICSGVSPVLVGVVPAQVHSFPSIPLACPILHQVQPGDSLPFNICTDQQPNVTRICKQ